MENNYITIYELTKYIKDDLESNHILQNVYLKGEISNFVSHSSGHLYFSLKDEKSRIKAIMFKSYASKLKFQPKEGMKVLVRGRITVYEATGDYQINVVDMQEDGLGNLYIAFEELKKKLEKEGLFDKDKKKKIPRISKKIGVVTAPTGAAIRDIITTIHRRFPIAEIYLVPSLVQGEAAASNIAAQINKAQEYDLDVLIVGRGGGSFEDLFPFSEEVVARAIYDSKIPIVSAVGHEIDYAISDFVADLRAATPTAAAELVVTNLTDVLSYFNQVKIRLSNVMTSTIKYKRNELKAIKDNKIFKNPESLYDVYIQKIDLLTDMLNRIIKNILEKDRLKLYNLSNSYVITKPEIIYLNQKNKLKLLIDKCLILNPVETLKRGYSITKKDDKVITTVKDLKTDDNITINMSDGFVDAKIINVKEDNNGE